LRLETFLCVSIALTLHAGATRAASDHYGQVTFANQPVPGATITANQGDQQAVTVSDQDGVYRLAGLDDGTWNIRVEMVGFSTVTGTVTLPSSGSPSKWELQLKSFEEITRELEVQVGAGGQGATAASKASGPSRADGPTTTDPKGSPPAVGEAGSRASATGSAGFQRAAVAAAAPVTAAPNSPAPEPAPDPMGAADGLLVNGTVNNAATSPFSQPRAFGNNRPGQQSLYTGSAALQLGNSSWDARPYSLTGQQIVRPSYRDALVVGTFGGPLRIPGLTNRANAFIGYQRSMDTTVVTQSALMPTALERDGDFSQTRDAFGQSIRIVDPATGRPFEGNRIPRDRLSPQAAALLAYYPVGDPGAGGQFNYQAPVVTGVRQDSVQGRLAHATSPRSQVFGTLAYQRTSTDSTSVFDFEDATLVSALDVQANWLRTVTLRTTVRLRYQFTRQTNRATPYFANRTNVSGDAGINGNNQEPTNWGPPTLTFSSGIEGLTDIQYGSTDNQTHAWSVEATWWSRGRHFITYGGDVRQHAIDIRAQQDPRGNFSFTGAATGSALADFLLGLPQTSSIAFGNADKFFRAASYDAYITDDWRFGPALTMNIGVRWEYEGPIAERFGRLVNLEVAPGFQAVAPVVANDPVGPLSGVRYPASLLRADVHGFQPRLAVAWRPVPGSSWVVRAGYGIYRNTNVYQSIATLLAQQPPLSTAFNIETSAANPLTLANGFPTGTGALNTFAVDPDFRVGYAQNWQASVQRDLPASMTVIGSYLGSKGSRLMQQFLPNTYPSGAENPCPTCPRGFRYLTSGGSSLRHAGQVQLRRRLRNGLTASAQYTLAKATDNAAAFSGATLNGLTASAQNTLAKATDNAAPFSGATLNGVALAQNWLDLDAEWGASSFDQRHLITVQVEYSTGVGVAGGTLVDGFRGALLKDWTFTGQLTAGSGLPLTPVYFSPVSGTGVSGPIRPNVNEAAIAAIPDGYYLNPTAYTLPSPGEWGNARRNSITGPSQFSLNGSLMRTFRMGDRINADWRIEAINVLNRVTFASVNMFVTSPQFGLPDRTNDMRKLRASLRVRF
jgi:Carboxypeptidase regulatory-like domain